MSLEIRPITLKAANDYVAANHRHNQRTTGHKWSLACYDGERLCGVAIAGRPIARKLDDGLTIEIRRVCTDGTRNACSMLYGACCRVAKAMGYKRVVTYTLVSEPGASLRASGFTDCGEAGGDELEYAVQTERGRADHDVRHDPQVPGREETPMGKTLLKGEIMTDKQRISDRQKELAYARQHRVDPGSPCERCKAPACPMVCRPKHDWEVRKYLKETKQGGFDKK